MIIHLGYQHENGIVKAITVNETDGKRGGLNVNFIQMERII